jgi:hypothetical protein
MEQYWMPKSLDFENLRKCIEKYSAECLFIRDCGGTRADGRYSAQGLVKVNENLEGKVLDFRKDDSGLYMMIDSEEVFRFSLANDYHNGFSLAYERIIPTDDGVGRIYMPSTGFDPDDEALPEPRSSTLRRIFDRHLIEITFKGKIQLEFHSWWDEKCGWKYWTVK